MSDNDEELTYVTNEGPVTVASLKSRKLSKLVVRCTACAETIRSKNLENVKKHKHLSVLTCKSCFEFYDDGEFSRDETGDQYCRWCADGGRLIACDFCTNAFCTKCILRNMGRKASADVSKTRQWKCYVCDPTPIKGHISFYKRMIKYIKKKGKRKPQDDDEEEEEEEEEGSNPVIDLTNGDSDSKGDHSWADPLFDHADKAIEVARIKMDSLKSRLALDKNEHNITKCSRKLKRLLSKHNKYIEYILVDIRNAIEEHESKDLVNGTVPRFAEGTRTEPETHLVNGNVSAQNAPVMEENVEGSYLASEEDNSEDSGSKKSKVKKRKRRPDAETNGDISKASGNSVLPEEDEKIKSDSSELFLSSEEIDAAEPLKDDGPESELVPRKSPVIQENLVESSLPDSEGDNDPVESILPGNEGDNDPVESILPDGENGNVQSLLLDSDDEEALLADEDGGGLELELSESDGGDHVTNDNQDFKGDGEKKGAGVPEARKQLRRRNVKVEVELEEKMVELDEKIVEEDENEMAKKLLLEDLDNSPIKGSEIRKNMKRKHESSSSSSDSEKFEEVTRPETPDIINDVKLRSVVEVMVQRLNIGIRNPDVVQKKDCDVPPQKKDCDVPPQNQGKKKCSEKPLDKTLDDVIANLSVLPKNKKRETSGNSHSGDSENDFEEDKMLLTKKRVLRKKSTSKLIISSASSDEEEEPTTKASAKKEETTVPKSKNDLAKDVLLNEVSNSSASSDVEVVPVNPKTGKSVPKVTVVDSSGSSAENGKDGAKKKKASDSDSSSSSSDFVIHNKFSKFDKLLRTRIEKNKNKKVTGGDKANGEENSKLGSKAKRRKVISDSDSSGSSSSSSSSSSSDSDSSEKPKKPTKKRKRIKTFSDSDNSDGKSAQDTPSQKGRKNIRRLIGEQELEKETKMAAVEERERRERVKARQKMYNQVTEEGGDFGEAVTKKLVLEFDPKTKEELVVVPASVICKLKPHQVNGVKFMWECCIESLSRLEDDKDEGSGCILAHCMGLGKTLQVIAFIATLLGNERVNKKICNILVVCPLNTIRNWSKEFDIWIGGTDEEISVFELANVKDAYDRADVLKHWHKSGGVMIMSYEIFRALCTATGGRKALKNCRATYQRTLLNPGPDMVFCDEGHVLKNEASALSKAMNRIQTRRRVVLTGTPLQNNLNEYHCMVQFVKPHLVGTKKEFLNRFVNPISNGQCADSTPKDVKVMKKRVHILHKLLEGCVQRCDYNHVTKYLPPKYEFVISVRLSESQISLYRLYLNKFSGNSESADNEDEDGAKKTSGKSLFKDYNILKLIWTHPYLLEMQKKRADMKAIFDEDSMSSFINDNSDESSAKSSKSSKSDKDDDDEVVCLNDPKPGTSSKNDGDSDNEVISNWKTRSRGRAGEDKSESEEEGPRNDQWWNEFVPADHLTRVELSGKIILLFEILKQCELVGDKVILFTQSLLSLDLIEELLQKLVEEKKNRPEEETTDILGTWDNGIDYFRMDGSTSADLRKKYIDIFNNPRNERARLFMISTKAGSLGTNMVGANRVVILDASWNPTHDVQAIFRVYRFGQKKPVYVYRLLAQGTMEEKIYDRQVTKQSMASRVVDEHQIERHFNAADLVALYSFEPDSKSNRPTPMVPKDMLLAEMLRKDETKEWIVTYHEHDSLLENISEEGLTEDERKVAWAEYEAEREGLLKQAQTGYMSPEDQYLLEEVTNDTTCELTQVILKIRQRQTNMTGDAVIRLIYQLDSLCLMKHKELTIISQSLRKSNENVPQEMELKMRHLQKLLQQIASVKKQYAEQQNKELQKQRLQEQAQRENYQRLLLQEQLRRQFQQQGGIPNGAGRGQPRYYAPNSKVGPTVADQLNAQRNYQQARNNNGPVEENVTVTRGPVVTEITDDDEGDEPTTSSSRSRRPGIVITELD